MHQAEQHRHPLLRRRRDNAAQDLGSYDATGYGLVPPQGLIEAWIKCQVISPRRTLARLKAAVAAGTVPNDFNVSKETTERQDRARTTLWRNDNSNFEGLKNIKVPVLVTDGRNDVIDPPKNSLIIANQIPFAWLAFYEGGHAFLFQSHEQFAATVNARSSAKPTSGGCPSGSGAGEWGQVIGSLGASRLLRTLGGWGDMSWAPARPKPSSQPIQSCNSLSTR